MIKKIFVAAIVGLSIILSGCASYTSVRQHQDLQQETKNIKSITILPADVVIELLAFTGENERETKKEETIANQLQNNAKYFLASQGATVPDFNFNEMIVERPDLAFAITQCKEALAKSKKTLYKGAVEEKNKSKFNENIGAAANTIAEATGTDAFLFIKYNGFEKTAGMITKDVVAAVLLTALTGQTQIAPKEGSSIEVALVAANSGAVLWTNLKAAPLLNTSVQQMAFKEFPKLAWKTADIASETATASATTSPTINAEKAN